MAKHRAPRYVRTKNALAKAPVAAGATVVGIGVFSSPAQASAPVPAQGPAGVTLEGEVPAPAPPRSADTGGNAATPASYVVAPGDTLTEIAAAHDQTWRELYHRNVAVIGSSPDLIFPGQEFVISGTADQSAPAPGPAPAPAPAPAPVPAPAPAVPAPAPAASPVAATATILNSAGNVAPQAQAAANRVVSEVPGASGITIGGTRAGAVDPNGHPSGRALDYMVQADAALGDAIVGYHVAHWDELGVEYVIWQQRILTSPTGAWKAMENRGSATANHMDHPHVNYRG